MRPAKTGTSMLSLIECRKGRRGMDGLRSKGIWDRRLQDEAFNARSGHAFRGLLGTRVCTRVSEAVRSVLEGPQWLIWTILTYMLHVECV